MSQFIPLSVPHLKGNEEQYVLDALRKEWVSTGGAYIQQFEEEIAKYVGAMGAVACQSGTAGLHLALQLSGVHADTEVIVPTLTFIAAVNPVKYLGATPIFMDCDETLTMDAVKLERFCKEECIFDNQKLINKNTGREIKAIVVVHVFGNIAHMEAIIKIAQQYHIKVIEDATEALGAYYTEGVYKGKFAGTIGDFGVYSFNGNKIITTGGGGMIIAQRAEDLKQLKYLSTQAKDDEVFYIHDEIGYNYRMTNLQAALGVAQLEQLEMFIHTKEENYKHYAKLFEQVDGIKLLPFNQGIRTNYWFYSLMVDFDKIRISQREFVDQLKTLGIQTRPIWGLIHEQKPYLSDRAYQIDVATYYQRHIINIPCSSNLSMEDVERVVEAIKSLGHR